MASEREGQGAPRSVCESVREEKDRDRDLSPGGYDKHYDYGRKERQRDESKLLFKESDIYRNGVDGRLARLCRVRVGELQYIARDFKGAGDVRVETFRLRATSENNVTRKRVTPDIRGKKTTNDGRSPRRQRRTAGSTK